MIRGKTWILATACITGLQSGIIISWARGLFALIADGKAQIVLSAQDEVFILNSMLIFKLIGSILSGYLMEKHGRRAAMIVLGVVNLIGWVPGFIGSTFVWLCLAQALHGVFNNAFVAVMPIVIGETMETEIRGAATTLLLAAVLTGSIVTSVLSATNYELYNGIPVIPAVALMGLVFMVKETPYYTLMKHGKDKARERFIWIRGYCDEENLTRMERRIHLQITRSPISWRLKGFKELLKGNTRKPLGVVLLFAFLSKISGYDTVDSLLATILPKSTISSSTAVFIMSFSSLSGLLIAMFLIDRVGRRPLTFISYLGSGVAFFSVAVWYYLYEHTSYNTESTLWFPVSMFALVGMFSQLGNQCLYHILMGELFGVDSSGRSSMIVTIVTAASLSLFNEAFHLVKKAAGMAIVMLICTVFNVIGCICVYVLLIETKGKTLEEIQEGISRKDDTPQNL